MKFVILGHFISGKDLKKAFPFGKYLPLIILEIITSLVPAKKSFRVVSHFNVFEKAEGWMIGLAMTPRQMMFLPKNLVRGKILQAVLFAQEKLGAEVLMLGALTSPLTSAGKWLTENPKVKIKITTGNTYTAAATIEAAEKALALANLDLSKIKLAIVGAAGVIGQALTKYFNQKGINLILVERSPEKFERLKPFLTGNNFKLTCDIKNIIEADIVITATSHPEAAIKPDFLKKNAIVVDVAEPPDLPKNINQVRPDVIAIDGGRILWKKVDLGMDINLPKNTGFACMTEVILQALEQCQENFVGSVDMGHLQRTKAWAEKWGFKLANFTSFNKIVPLEKFNNLKQKYG